jgi:hypothetical protein
VQVTKVQTENYTFGLDLACALVYSQVYTRVLIPRVEFLSSTQKVYGC